MGAALKPVAKQALMEAGGALGGLAGSRLGSSSGGAKVGRTIGARLSKIFGCGDYVVNEKPVVNSLLHGGQAAYASFGNNGQSIRIQHREYLFDLAQGPTASVFTNYSYAINPGLIGSFPYLAPIAANFEEYRIRGLVFEFISSTSPYLSGGAMGTVVMSMNYNPLSPLYTSKIQMENSDFAISARPDQSMVYGVECSVNTQNLYYVRQGSTAAPLTATDLGNMQFAVQSPIAANTVLGEVWVSYDIELCRPRSQTLTPGYFHIAGVGGGAGSYPLTVSLEASYGILSGLSYGYDSGVLTLTFPQLASAQSFTIYATAKVAGSPSVALNTPAIAGVGTLAILGNGAAKDGQAYGSMSNLSSASTWEMCTVTGGSVVTVTMPAANTGATSMTYDIIVQSVMYGSTATSL